jgi:hypothetical protein
MNPAPMRRRAIYDFIDRPVTSLNRGGRLLVRAMRHWVRAAQAGRCPCGDIRPAFDDAAVADALPHFHVMMAVLNRHAVAKMAVGHVDCARVNEHEALAIAMVCTMGRGGPARVAGTAALLVGEHHATHLLVPIAALAQVLADANRLPAGPIHDPDCTRFPNE